MLTARPGRFATRKRPGTSCTGGWVDPRASLDWYGKSRPPPDFFLFLHSLVLSFIHTRFFVLIALHFVYMQHVKQSFLLPAGFEPAIAAGERPQTYALRLAATLIRSPDRPACSWLLYRLSYPGPRTVCIAVDTNSFFVLSLVLSRRHICSRERCLAMLV